MMWTKKMAAKMWKQLKSCKMMKEVTCLKEMSLTLRLPSKMERTMKQMFLMIAIFLLDNIKEF